MKKILAEKLAGANDALSLRDDYSGRGMFGATTYAVVGSLADIWEALGEIGLAPDWHFSSEDEKEEFYFALKNGLRQDQMGTDKVFY